MTSVSSNAFPILYKKRKDGKFQVYSISVVEENGFPVILSSSWQDGMKDTSMITDRNVIYEGKNLGKKNETTAYEQAILEAESDHKNKVKKGYRLSKDEERIVQPMLAKTYDKETLISYMKKNFKKGDETRFVLQPKLDGCRALLHVVRNEDDYTVNIYSRQTTSFNVQCRDILSAFRNYISVNDLHDSSEFFIDGELYMYGDNENIQLIAGTLNKKEYDPDLHSKLFLVVYDLYDLDNPDMNYFNRMIVADNYISKCYKMKHIRDAVDNKIVESSDHSVDSLCAVIKSYHDECIAKGFEGAMLRAVKEPYMPFHRSLGLMKVKEFDTNEYIIIGVDTPSTGREQGTAIIRCRLNDQSDKVFDAVSIGTREYRQQLYDDRDKIIGKYVTIQHQAFTMDGVPRFPKAIVVRDYE
jgi:ATP-dependent DNA ligase